MDTKNFHGMSGREILKLYCCYLSALAAMLVIMVLLEPFYKYSPLPSWIHWVALVPFFIMLASNKAIMKRLSADWVLNCDGTAVIVKKKERLSEIPLSTIREIKYIQIENEKYSSPLLSGRSRIFKLKAKDYHVTLYVSIGKWTPYSSESDLDELDAFFEILQKKCFLVFDEAEKSKGKYLWKMKQ